MQFHENYIWTFHHFIIAHFAIFTGEESGEIHIIRVVMSWRNAKEYCQVNHGDLVSVRSETENRALHEKLIEAKMGDTFLVWIGLFRDKWTWSDHSMSSSRYWSPSQPNKDGDCVLYNTHSRDWYDRGCASTFGFICYRGENVQWLSFCHAYHAWFDKRECDTPFSPPLCLETVKRRIVMMEIKANSALDFSDAALSESMLNQVSISQTCWPKADSIHIHVFWNTCWGRRPQSGHMSVWRGCLTMQIFVLLWQIQGKLEGVKLKWKVHPDGKIFHKKEKERNEDF